MMFAYYLFNNRQHDINHGAGLNEVGVPLDTASLSTAPKQPDIMKGLNFWHKKTA
jgi:hypothetical protein